MSFETSRASVISGILFEVSGEIWIPVKSVVKSLECQNRKTSRSFKSCCRYADLDCRMERMKNNCRKAAMETRQQHIQVDLGISPERWLCETLRTYKILSCSKSEGITLERELLLRSKL